MAISRIKTDGIQDEAVTSAKIGDNIDLDGQYVRVPHGTTAERPSSPAAGYLRFNTDQGTLEQWNTNSNSWAGVDSPPVITSLAYTGSATAADPAGGETITLTGTNFKTGATVRVDGTTAPTISVVNSTTITFTTPAKTAGDYDVVVVNSNGLQATLTSGISYNGVPAFTSPAAGNIGSVIEDEAMSTITIVAAEPDSGTISYSVTTGALPTGVSLGSANGQITGTPNVNVTSNTDYNFTVSATDDENQVSTRAYTLTVLRQIYATPIANSLQFETSQTQYLHRTPASAGNRRTWTWSAWVKQSRPAKDATDQNTLFSAYTDNNNRLSFDFVDTDLNPISFYGAESGSQSVSIRAASGSVDFSAWQHIMIAVDTTQATASDRVKIYNNGTQITDLSASSYPTQNAELHVNASAEHLIGSAKWNSTAGYFYNGYMADIYFIDGQALTPTSFAEEHNGVWAPKPYSGTYGTNGFHLEFGDDQNIGDDTSGNTNDLTANNIGGWRVMDDSPTNNFPTMNIRDSGSNAVSLSSGALELVSAGTNYCALGVTISFDPSDSDGYYWEVCCTGSTRNGSFGIIRSNARLDNYYNQTDTPFYQIMHRGSGGGNTYWHISDPGDASPGTDTGILHAQDDIIGIAVKNSKIYYHVNGTWVSSCDPETETNPIATIDTTYDSGKFKPWIATYSTTSNVVVNFGQNPSFNSEITAGTQTDASGLGTFKYAPPTGFKALHSKNIPDSTINPKFDDRPEDYFDMITWTGDGTATRSFTDLTFQPDWVFAKHRSGAIAWSIYDSVRGAGAEKELVWNQNQIEGAGNNEQYGYLSSFDSNGFTASDGSGSPNYYFNQSGTDYIAYCWKAGGAPTADNANAAGQAPTSGSVMIDGSASTSTLAGNSAVKRISANTKSGFSIVQYTGNGSDRTMPHGLSSAPEMMLVHGTTGTPDQWQVYHDYAFANTLRMEIPSLATPSTGSPGTRWANTDPTDTVFSIGSNGAINTTNNEYIAYLFHSVPGYSRVGIWNNNNRNDGTYIHTGFKPAFILLKNYDDVESWYILDNRLNPTNKGVGGLNCLRLNTDAGVINPNSNAGVDFLSNGFKILSANTASGEISFGTRSYLYLAFAEDPFKFSEAK